MLTTAWLDGQKIDIDDYKKQAGKDPLCPLGHRLVGKKGKKVVHHFAHYALEKCDPWRQGLSGFHSQWQKIVLDKKNIEVCMNADGTITGNSSFRGYSSFSQQQPIQQQPQQNPTQQSQQFQSMFSDIPSIPTITTEAHIADIIKPNFSGGRPLVVEIQNSSIDKASIDSREKYYQNMVWVFNLTPRVVSPGKHNKVVFVDGKVSYLKEKVIYVAMISSLDMKFRIGDQSGQNIGDQCLGLEPKQIYGIFIIINTRTKYWFETTKPTYFDCGYGILRLIMKLDKGFAFTLYMSYEDFCNERMPEINKEIYATCGWFHTQNPMNLIKLNIVPQIINVPNIYSCKDRIIIYHNGNEFQGMGLERGRDCWQWFDSYNQQKQTITVVNNQTPKQDLYLNSQGVPTNPLMQHPTQSTVIINNQDLLTAMMTSQMTTTQNPQLALSNSPLNHISLINKLRTFLGVSSNVNIEIENMRGSEQIVVYCNKETYNMKDKFKTLGMTYRKVSKSEKRTKSKINKSVDNAIQASHMNQYYSQFNSGIPMQTTIVSFDSFKADKLANAVMTTESNKGSFYHAALKGFEDKLNKLV